MQRLYFILPLLLLMSCSDSVPKETQLTYVIAGPYDETIHCKKLRWANNSANTTGITLTDCDYSVKEVINATNIVIYE